MNEVILQQIIEDTFKKIACPLNGYGMYATVQKAVLEAYNIGKAGKNNVVELKPLVQEMIAS